MRSAAIAFGLAILILPSAVSAQEIRGIVVEDGTRTPIAGVIVELLTRDSTIRATAVTATTGWFQLPAGSEGQFFLRTSHPSYAASGIPGVSVEKSEIVTVVLKMGRAAIPLEPLVVTARSRDRLSAFRERAERHGMGRYILRDEIESRVAARASDLLRMTPGLRIESIRDASGVFTSNVILMRSLGELCAPAIYLDGIPVNQDFGFDIDDLITTDLLEGIEIYSSHVTAPLELHVPTNACGIIAFWSRPARGKRLTWKQLTVGALLASMMFLLSR